MTITKKEKEQLLQIIKNLETVEEKDYGWRLPTIQELLTLVNYNKANPASDLKDTKNSRYWSSTTYASDTSTAWVVFFYNGYDYWYYKTDSYYVRCVREKEDGKLEWSKSSINPMNWDEALEYAKTLTDKDVYV